MKKTGLALLLTAAMLCGLLSACGQSSGEEAAPQEETAAGEETARTELVSDLEDAEIIDTVVENFMQLAAVPRPSHHEEEISAYLVSWAGKQDCEAVQDEMGNVMFDVPATEGLEDLPLTALQGHMDMVCVAADGVEHDFLADPIQVIWNDKDDTLTANGTSLGADDGAGVALIMSAVQGRLAHGPLRVLITVDEEDGMEGAFNMDAAWLRGVDYLINIDNEVSNEVLVSTAAGDAVLGSGSVTTQAPAGDTAVSLELKGLKGGHSGVEIGKGRLNGILAMGRLLDQLTQAGVGWELVSLRGGTASNAIPDKASAEIVIDAAQKEALEETAAAFRDALAEEYAGIEDGVQLLVSDGPEQESVLSQADRDNVMTFLTEIRDGVNTWSADMEGLVESSSNLGIFTAGPEGVSVSVNLRSSVGSLEDELLNGHLALCERCGYDAETVRMADPWPYDPDSRLLALTREVYRQLNGEEIIVSAVHAGLECGTFAELNPDMEMVSIGPDLSDVHSPKETLYLDSVPRTWRLLEGILTSLGSLES